MKDIQRDGWEYELTVSLSIDRDTHMATASKDRTGMFINADPFVITQQTGEMIRDWCEQGKERPEDPMQFVLKKVREATSVDELVQIKAGLTNEQVNDKKFIAEATRRYKELSL